MAMQHSGRERELDKHVKTSKTKGDAKAKSASATTSKKSVAQPVASAKVGDGQQGDQERRDRPPRQHASRCRSPRERRPGLAWAKSSSTSAAPVHHHEPRRLDRLQDGRRGDPQRLEPARDGHRHLEVLPQSRALRRRKAGREERSAGRPPHREHDPPGRREVRRLLRHEGGRRCVRGRARLPHGPPDRRVQLASLVQLRSVGPVRHHRLRRKLGVGSVESRRAARSSRRRTPTSARSARRASSRPRTTTS